MTLKRFLACLLSECIKWMIPCPKQVYFLPLTPVRILFWWRVMVVVGWLVCGGDKQEQQEQHGTGVSAGSGTGPSAQSSGNSFSLYCKAISWKRKIQLTSSFMGKYPSRIFFHWIPPPASQWSGLTDPFFQPTSFTWHFCDGAIHSVPLSPPKHPAKQFGENRCDNVQSLQSFWF